MTDDAALLRRYAGDRSEAAFTELVQRHVDLVYSAALRQMGGDHHGARDVTQMVFINLARKAASLVRHPVLPAWLYRAVHLEAANTRRREGRRQKYERLSGAEADIAAIAGDAPAWDQVWPVVDEAMNGLNERDRQAILLRFFSNCPFAEVGRRMGLTENAARMRVARALDKLNGLLTRRSIMSSSAALAAVLASQAVTAAPVEVAIAATAAALTGTGGAPAFGILQFMSTSKLVAGAAVLAGILAIGFSLHEHTLNREAEATLAAANREIDSSFARIQELGKSAQQTKQEIGALGRELESLRARLAERAVMASAANGAAATRAYVPKAQPPVNRELSDNPDVRAALSGWIKAEASVFYGPVFKYLGLSAAQIAAFDDLLLQQDIGINGTFLTLRPDGVSAEDFPQAVRALLGDADAQVFFQYQPAAYASEVASGLAGNLYDSETPLSPQQGEQLTQILAQGNYPGHGAFYSGTVDWNSALAQAQGILSAPQFAAFQNEVTLISSQPGAWGALNPLHPGTIGNTPTIPAAFLNPRDPLK